MSRLQSLIWLAKVEPQHKENRKRITVNRDVLVLFNSYKCNPDISFKKQ